MTEFAFDTHAFVKKLTKAGMPEPQAEIFAEDRSRLIVEHLATKMDVADIRKEIKQIEASLKKDIENLRQETKKDIENLRQETKKDIEALRQETKQIEANLKRDIENLRRETKKDIAIAVHEAKVSILKWMFSAMTAQAAIVIGAIKLL